MTYSFFFILMTVKGKHCHDVMSEHQKNKATNGFYKKDDAFSCYL